MLREILLNDLMAVHWGLDEHVVETTKLVVRKAAGGRVAGPEQAAIPVHEQLLLEDVAALKVRKVSHGEIATLPLSSNGLWDFFRFRPARPNALLFDVLRQSLHCAQASAILGAIEAIC
jgi:hypothetical protein